MENKSTHLFEILQKYLRRENYFVNKEDFQLQLLSNPTFPSLRSITDTLDYFRIENIAAIVPKSALPELPRFFLAVIDGKSKIAQVEKTRRGLRLYYDDGTRIKLTNENFTHIWNGKFLVIEKQEKRQLSMKVSLKNPLLPLVLLALSSICIGIINQELMLFAYSCFASIGTILSFYIVQEDFGIYNEATAKLCNSASSNSNCSDVIFSKYAELFNLFKASDLSITYFTSLLIILSSIGYNETIFFGFAIATTPIIIYSIYVQAFAIKKWCPLCLMVAIVIAGMSIISFSTVEVLSFSTSYFLKVLVVFSIVYLFWISLKSLIEKSVDLQKVTTDYLKFKRNKDLFFTLLTKKSIPGIFDFDKNLEIIFGNPEADLTLTTITNPTCGYCTNSFQEFDNLLKTHGEHFRLRMVFAVNNQKEDDVGFQIAQRIVDMYQTNTSKSYEMIKDWYSDKNFDRWQSKFQKSEEFNSLEILKHHVDWSGTNKIPGTPTTLVEDYFFPMEYDLEDLVLFIEILIENQGNIIKSQDAQFK